MRQVNIYKRKINIDKPNSFFLVVGLIIFIIINFINENIKLFSDDIFSVVSLVLVAVIVLFFKKRTKTYDLGESYHTRKKIESSYKKNPNVFVYVKQR